MPLLSGLRQMCWCLVPGGRVAIKTNQNYMSDAISLFAKNTFKVLLVYIVEIN